MKDLKVVLLNNIFELNDMDTQPKWWSSSIDPAELSLTIKGLLLMYVPTIIAIAQFYNYKLDHSMIVNLIGGLSLVMASIVSLVGLIRKAIVWFKK